MNAIEYGSQGNPEVPFDVRVDRGPDLIGSGSPTPASAAPSRAGDAEVPDLERKLAGEQKPRGWGLFLIEQMVDAWRSSARATPDRRPHPRPRRAAA